MFESGDAGGEFNLELFVNDGDGCNDSIDAWDVVELKLAERVSAVLPTGEVSTAGDGVPEALDAGCGVCVKGIMPPSAPTRSLASRAVHAAALPTRLKVLTAKAAPAPAPATAPLSPACSPFIPICIPDATKALQLRSAGGSGARDSSRELCVDDGDDCADSGAVREVVAFEFAERVSAAFLTGCASSAGDDVPRGLSA